MTKMARNPDAMAEIKDGIIDKAVAILSEEGFDRLTMRRIAEVAGMSATNLYNYFTSKDEIYITILIKGFENLYEIFLNISSLSDNPVEKGRKLMKAYLKFGIKNSHYYDIMFTRPAPKYNDYVNTPLESMARIEMDYSREIIKISRKAISDIISEKKMKKEDPGLKLLQLWAMVHGLIVLNNSNIVNYLNENPSLDSTVICEQAIDDILKNM